jgi:xanthine dehydrogenase accessory factor
MVTVAAVEGSAPREAGARLIVVPGGGFYGTIGGGALEWHALAEAQAALEQGTGMRLSRHALGPELGQCCGGRVSLLTEVFDGAAMERAKEFSALEAAGALATRARIGEGSVLREPVAPAAAPAAVVLLRDGVLIERFGEQRREIVLFGAGHVGRALVLALAPLPFDVLWIDPRANAFPAAMPANARAVHSAAPAAELARAGDGAFVLVMTHSHPLDLEIVRAALAAGRFPYVGLIGSATKRARFTRLLRQAGIPEAWIAELKCPIGIAGITSKAPAAIAAATVAELLIRDEALRAEQEPIARLERFG